MPSPAAGAIVEETAPLEVHMTAPESGIGANRGLPFGVLARFASGILLPARDSFRFG